MSSPLGPPEGTIVSPLGPLRPLGRALPGSLPVWVMVACLGPGDVLLAQKSISPHPELINPRIEQAIERGIQYLLSERKPEGHWEYSQASRKIFPCANTALVGLTLLAHGSTPTRGPHAKVVREITDKLLEYSTWSGVFEAPYGEYREMYSHAFSMTFLATVFGQEGDPDRRERIRIALRKGITLCMRVQAEDGGWGYHANYEEDREGTLVVTQLMGLRACQEAGIPVSKSMVDNAVKFIKDSKMPNDGWVRYRVGDSRVRRGVTCAAVVALWNAGEYDSDDMRQIQDVVLSEIQPRSPWWHSGRRPGHGEYIEYYLAQVMWILGGERWESHYRRISAYLLKHQDADGSWDADDTYQYGPVYTTTMALLILQLPYKRLPIYQR